MGVLLQFQDVSGSTESCWRGCLLIRLHASLEVNLMGLEYSLANKLAKGPGQTLAEPGCMPEHGLFACVAYQFKTVNSGLYLGVPLGLAILVRDLVTPIYLPRGD